MVLGWSGSVKMSLMPLRVGCAFPLDLMGIRACLYMIVNITFTIAIETGDKPFGSFLGRAVKSFQL